MDVLLFVGAWAVLLGLVALAIEIMVRGPAAALPFFPGTRLP